MLDERRLRLLLRKGEARFITQALVCKILRFKKEEATQALHRLEYLGYIEEIGIDGCWGVAIRGKLYASQRLKKLYTVKSIQRHLDAFKERVTLINSSQEFTHSINKVKITNEYPITSRSSGIRIAYSLIRKKIGEDKYREVSRKLIAKSKKRIDSIFDRVIYPQTAIHERLKSRSHILKLTRMEDEDIDNIKGHLIFDAK